MKYKNKFINLIILVFTIIILCVLNFCFFRIPNDSSEKIADIKIMEDEKKDDVEKKDVDLGNWYIKIPSISLAAPIAEGTGQDTLNTKVGHFEDTSLENGNVGLAAHNRGYEFNFFADLKKVKIDDEIIYTHENYEKTYIVEKNEIIRNSDWSYLENSDENKITLITCVENEPEFRRCVQGTLLEDEGI